MNSHSHRQRAWGKVLLELSLLGGFWRQLQAHAGLCHAVVVGRAAVATGLFGGANGHQELALEGLAEGDVEEGVEAAVGVAQANGKVVGIKEGHGWGVDAQVNELQDVEGSPANKKGGTDGDCHSGDLLGTHPETPLGQRHHGGGHVLEDLEIDHADDDQGHSKGQHELVEGEPVDVGLWVGEQESTAHGPVLQGHEACVHPHGNDGQEGQEPHQADDESSDTRRPDVGGLEGVHGGQVTVQCHHCEDVGAGDLAVCVQGGDDGAQGSSKVP